MQRILVGCPFHMTCTEISRILCEIHTRLLLQSKHTDHHTHTLMPLFACRLLLRRRRLAGIGLACEKLRRASRASTNARETELSLTLSPLCAAGTAIISLRASWWDVCPNPSARSPRPQFHFLDFASLGIYMNEGMKNQCEAMIGTLDTRLFEYICVYTQQGMGSQRNQSKYKKITLEGQRRGI